MTRHPLSIVGAWITTLSAFIFLFVFLIDLFGLHSNPYVGLLFFLILPMFFVLGLLMIPAWDCPGAAPSEEGARRPPHASDRPERSGSSAGDRHRARADDCECHDRLAGGLPRRRVHGFAAVLRSGLPHRDGTGVRGAPRWPAFASDVRRMPRWLGCAVVRLLQAERNAPACPSGAQQLSAGRFLRRSSTSVRPAAPARCATGRRSSMATRWRSSRHTPTTRRTRARRRA